ncbi:MULTISPECIES: hypothetical protein [Variovorax]|jgi:hypothetical protein|uniref:hypothetical protein n=1 Tax=Variovorax TaxID=34072 RepID=UPI00137EAAC0|nr:hypothetical protein [Variovorax sp.]KAF1066159.1 MAG: hypothetical protein GAK39_05103 [Variovorax sp.]QRF59492.1 hypothetical protein INQ48_09825 [Variovorax paradoxus]
MQLSDPSFVLSVFLAGVAVGAMLVAVMSAIRAERGPNGPMPKPGSDGDRLAR